MLFESQVDIIYIHTFNIFRVMDTVFCVRWGEGMLNQGLNQLHFVFFVEYEMEKHHFSPLSCYLASQETSANQTFAVVQLLPDI